MIWILKKNEGMKERLQIMVKYSCVKAVPFLIGKCQLLLFISLCKILEERILE